MDRAVEGGEALLAVPVHVVGELVAGLLHRFEESREQRACGRSAFEHERAVAAPVVVATREACLHSLEVGQAVGVVPVRHARISRPALVVEGVSTLEDHPVDAAGATEQLPPGMVDAPPAHVRLRLRLVLPVVKPVPDRHREGCRHVD